MTVRRAGKRPPREGHPPAGTGFRQEAARYLPSHQIAQLGEPSAQPAIAAHLLSLLQTVTTYLPRRLVHTLLADPIPGQVGGELLQGTLLLADLSGFTVLSAALGVQGQAEAERVVSIVNAIFTTMLEIVDRENGDLLVFGGDALLALFTEEGHQISALRAARAMQQSMAVFGQIETEIGPFPLAMHIGVNSGSFLAANVGLPHAMQYILLGQAVEETAQAEALAGPGQIIAGSSTVQGLALAGDWKPLAGPWFEVPLEVPLPPVPHRRAETSSLPTGGDVVLALDTLVPHLPAGLLQRLIPYPAEPTVEADLKPVAVLFANVVGFESLLHRLGPERLQESVALLQRYVVAFQEIVERYGGTLNKVDASQLGIKLLVLFGAPTKHEDDPERAVRAALDMQAELASLGTTLAGQESLSLQQRIGLHTGEVFAGNVGSAWRKEYTVMGTTVNIAARLMAAAEPGEIWATAALYDRVGSGCQGQGPQEIQAKGWDDPLQAYRILDLKATRRRAPTIPLIGREQEMGILQGGLEETLQGRGHPISLVGEAGVGKSRLVEEVVALAHDRGLNVRIGHTPSYGTRIPYAPWTDILRAYLGWTAEMADEERIARLRARLASLSPELDQWAPLVAEALGLSLHETEWTAELSPRLRRLRFFDLALQFLQADAAQRPLLVVLEDLYWAGPLVGELLTYLARNIAASGVMLLGTFRPSESDLPWEGLSHHRRIELGPLDPQHCRELVTTLSGCSTLEPTLADLIWERAQGNPLFVEEVVRVLEERGQLLGEQGCLRLQGSAERARQEIPLTVQEVILSRIDLLPEGIRSVLRVASVIDPEFLFPVLVAVFPRAESKAILRDRVERLCRTGTLIQVEPETFSFHHTLTREVAYQSIPPARRQSLHEQVGRYYEEHFGHRLEQYYGLLAHHYRHSANRPKATEYAIKAGRQAAHSYANEAAATYFLQALEMGALAPVLLPPRERLQILRERGEVLVQAGRFSDALLCYQEALQQGKTLLEDVETAELYRLCGVAHERSGHYEEGLDVLQKAHRILLRSPQGRVGLEMPRLLAVMSGVYWRMATYDKAAHLGSEALLIAQQLAVGRERSSLLGQIHSQQGTIAATVGQYQEALEHFEAAAHFHEEAGKRPEIAVDLNNLGYLWHLQDEYERAIDSYQRCLEVSRQVGNPYIAAYAANNLGSAWYELGDYDRARTYCRESLSVRERIGDQAGMASCWDTMGLIDTAQGRFEQALELHERSLALKRKLGDTFQQANSLINIARSHIARTSPPDALSASREALRLLQEMGVRTLLAEAHAVAGQAFLALGKQEEALHHAEAALQTAAAVGGRKDRAVAARVLAETLAADASPEVQRVEQLFRQSIETLAAIHCRLEWARACQAYAGFLLARGEASSAHDYLEKAQRLLDEIGVVQGAE